MSFRIAAICTQYHPLSHADVIVTRWLEPHRHDASVGFAPVTTIASLYVAQRPRGDPPPADWFGVSPNGREERYDPSFDISRLVSDAYGVPIFNSVREALTLGGHKLAVDAVLLIGEHGDYPANEFGQKLYPRKELFDEIVMLFRESQRVVPLFCDKHLSWNMDWAREMISTVQELGIPFFAGSSAPLTGMAPPLRLPDESDLEASIGLFYTGSETYGIHSLELVQSVIERRRGGEAGIAAITAYEGEAVWEAMQHSLWTADLFDAALAACPSVQAGDYRANCRASAIAPVACVAEHVDGHQQMHVMLHGHISNFAVSVTLRGEAGVRAAVCDDGRPEVFVVNFAHLCRELERFFLTGRSPVPNERNLLTTLTVATFMQALKRPGERLVTPHLRIAYSAHRSECTHG